MNQEIVKELMIISLRNGVEINIEKEKLELLISQMETKRFINVNGSIINTADISGVFSPQELESVIRRKNGQWQDKKGQWQDKGTRACPKCGNILPYGKICGLCV